MIEVVSEFQAERMLGEKVLEMVDRISGLETIIPNGAAEWDFEVDGKVYKMTVNRKEQS